MRAATTARIAPETMKPAGTQVMSTSLRLAAIVNGSRPTATCSCNADIARWPERSGSAVKRNFLQTPAGAPLMAQTRGRSLAASWDDQITTRSDGLVAGIQTKQLVQSAVTPRSGSAFADRDEESRDSRLTARGPVRDGQRLSRQPEDDLLVGDEAGQADAVHADVPLFPTARSGQGLLLGFLVAERLVAAPRGDPSGRGERCSRRRVQLGRVMHLDHLRRIEMRGGDVG